VTVASDTGVPTDDTIVDEVPAARPLPAHPILAALVEDHDRVSWRLSAGQDVVEVPVDELTAFAGAAKAAGFELGVDLTVVDRLGRRDPRFEVVVVLRSIRHGVMVRLLVEVPSEDDPVVPSLTPWWPGLSFFEREAFDMFGVRFEGHPDLTRILMPDDWEGHPLRKDYAVGDVPVQFKASPKVS
jgi:NADH-quinone oxidoreductase subunit C